MKIERNIAHSLLAMITKYQVIALTGPRQSGKTTLLKDLFSEYDYVSLENPDNRAFADSDPNGFLLRYASKVIIDEAQRLPHIFSYIQTKVDESNEMGQYILSGSQNFHLMQEITQSLAGRVAIFKLFPFDLLEMKDGGILNKDYLANLITGFYPAIFDRKIKPRTYYSNYIQTYIQRDVSQIIGIRDQNSFKK
ncbi:MAG: AAA family ATPase, partial [Bacteroidetes bacterium]|nr:AAA family ATPase [Bacteroidota bacterium]